MQLAQGRLRQHSYGLPYGGHLTLRFAISPLDTNRAWHSVEGSLSLRPQVNYSDGDVETVWLAAERVRLALAPGEALPEPTPDALRQLASQLQAGAGTAEHRALLLDP